MHIEKQKLKSSMSENSSAQPLTPVADCLNVFNFAAKPNSSHHSTEFTI